MSTPAPPPHDRVLMLRTGPRHVVALTATPPPRDVGWRELPLEVARTVAQHLTGVTPGTDGTPALSGRFFELRPEDVAAWDASRHVARDGEWVYGVNWNDKGKYDSWASFRELETLPTGARPPDPVAVATAVAIADLQESLHELVDLTEHVALTVEAVLTHQRRAQEGDVLAIEEIVAEVYDRYTTDGTLDAGDWDRLAALELPIRSQHRQLLGELAGIQHHLAFATAADADALLKDPSTDPDRAADLLELAWRNLTTVHRWTILRLAAMDTRGTLTAADVTRAELAAGQYVQEVADATAALTAQDTTMARTPWHVIVRSADMHRRGLLGTVWHERGLAQRASQRRTMIADVAEQYSTRPALPGPALLAVLPADGNDDGQAPEPAAAPSATGPDPAAASAAHPEAADPAPSPRPEEPTN